MKSNNPGTLGSFGTWSDRVEEGKVRRQPTLAQAIHVLPSAMRCLTAEFGMGSGRATALWPP